MESPIGLQTREYIFHLRRGISASRTKRLSTTPVYNVSTPKSFRRGDDTDDRIYIYLGCYVKRETIAAKDKLEFFRIRTAAASVFIYRFLLLSVWRR